MKPLFKTTGILDQAVKNRFALTDDIMMENAAEKLLQEVLDAAGTSSATVLIVCGSGNNGADGLVLARKLHSYAVNGKNVNVAVYQPLEPKSAPCQMQRLRAEKVGVTFVDSCIPCNIVVDCLLGSGLHGKIDTFVQDTVAQMNALSAFKISCDIPSCLGTETEDGQIFTAEVTITMGALKTMLYDDRAKAYTGRIVCANLGVSRSIFEKAAGADCLPQAFLLETSDICLPSRTKSDVHKGTFGHAVIAGGEKIGSAVIASSAAFAFGAGLVTLVHKKECVSNIPFDIMQSVSIPENVSAIAVGMGLGIAESTEYVRILSEEYCTLPCVIDADMFHVDNICRLLKKRSECAQSRIILTPHPKEFSSLLHLCNLAEVSAAEIQKNRFLYAEMFCRAYPGIILVLKGANPIIACSSDGDGVQIFINPLGKPCLAKGGSGDVLSGLICALLAQRVLPLEAAIQASLVHAYASTLSVLPSSYSMGPFDLILAVRHLEITGILEQQ